MKVIFRAPGTVALVMLAMSGLWAVAASAETGGHFMSDVTHTHLIGTEGGTHQIHFLKEGSNPGEKIGCDKDIYTGTASGQTVTQTTLKPSWSECYTTGSPNTKFEIHENSCDLLLTIKNASALNTAHITCGIPGDSFVITHPNCSIRMPPQTLVGFKFVQVTEGGKNATRVVVNTENVTTHYEGGICIFLGTTHQGAITGTITLQGWDATARVNIAAT